ncbi:MAG TPA: YgiQ family radical SAM protein [Syntrophomonadaceae bacterium]|nr:YgiQ family radical SAM protein [Syntrophomonadaceae bacterium]
MFLPINKSDVNKRGWDELDIIIVSGDAYVDHPAWAAAVLGRLLENQGFRIGIIPQPDWKSIDDFKSLGKPRLFFAVAAGNVDSLVSHYSAEKNPRRHDAYSPGGIAGLRPDRATIVYSNRIKEAYPQTPILIGGVEASLRRLAHYDYWSDQVRNSILIDSRADLLVYGMGEYILSEIAKRAADGEELASMHDIRGTCYVTREIVADSILLPSVDKLRDDPQAFADMTKTIYQSINPYNAKTLAQPYGNRFIVQNLPAYPLTSEQLDKVYELPYMRKAHPIYDKAGGIPGLESVQFSVVTHRGCFGGCSFCSLALHQGKFIQSRSQDSIIKEAHHLTLHPDFKGTIPDVGGPSANMYELSGQDASQCESCRRNSCIYPNICKNLNTDHSSSVDLWQELRQIKQVKNIFIASGVRYDLLLKDTSQKYLRDLCQYHVGGQLKIAPEHINDYVAGLMNKPGRSEYVEFTQKFKRINQELGKEQYLIPYFIAAHPGCSSRDMLQLAEFIRDHLQYYPEQVQNFTPTPMTISTCMYYTGLNPMNGKKVSVPKGRKIRSKQRALLQYRNPSNYDLVYEALQELKREDLIGKGRRSLIQNRTPKVAKGTKKKKRNPR